MYFFQNNTSRAKQGMEKISHGVMHDIVFNQGLRTNSFSRVFTCCTHGLNVIDYARLHVHYGKRIHLKMLPRSGTFVNGSLSCQSGGKKPRLSKSSMLYQMLAFRRVVTRNCKRCPNGSVEAKLLPRKNIAE